MNQLYVCCFDIDGTLLNSGGAGLAALETALKSEFGITMEPGIVPTAGRTDFAIVSDILSHHEIEETDGAVSRLTAAYLSHLPHMLAQRVGGALPGIPKLLALLDKRDDVVMGLLTGNFYEGARIKLQHYQLYDYFHFGGYGDRCRERDDVARVALEAARRHCRNTISMERFWVIGDTPADVQCARAIGAKAIGVGTGFVSKSSVLATKPDYFFDDLSAPEELLRLLT